MLLLALAVILVLAVIMLFTGCAKEEEVNPFPGTWTGTLDYTQSFTDSMLAEHAELEKFVKFENLTFTFVFAFTNWSFTKLLHLLYSMSVSSFLSPIQTDTESK